jgi:hypothetical protein
MKKICLLLMLQALSLALFAQKRTPPFEEIKDGEYTVRILPAPGGTYGFDILKGNKVMVHQLSSPFPKGRGMQGLKKKEDVVKVTRYLVQQARKTGRPPAPMLPDAVAKELQITQ